MKITATEKLLIAICVLMMLGQICIAIAAFARLMGLR